MMSRTALSFLFRVEPPFVFLGPGEPERSKWDPNHFYATEGVSPCVRRLRGSKMRTVASLMDEVSAALQFFDGFGENWYALEECLSYLDEWLPADAYILVVEEAEELLADQPDQLGAFLITVNRAGESWAAPVTGNERFNRPPVPFHVLLSLSNTAPAGDAAERIRHAAAAVEVALRGL